MKFFLFYLKYFKNCKYIESCDAKVSVFIESCYSKLNILNLVTQNWIYWILLRKIEYIESCDAKSNTLNLAKHNRIKKIFWIYWILWRKVEYIEYYDAKFNTLNLVESCDVQIIKYTECCDVKLNLVMYS